MSEDGIFIQGLGLQGYRSFGKTLQKIGPFSRVNLIIGKNNSGKSNILKFIHEYYFKCIEAVRYGNNKVDFNDLDFHAHGEKNDEIRVAFAVKKDEEFIQTFREGRLAKRLDLQEYLFSILNSPSLLDEYGYLWFVYERLSGSDTTISQELIDSVDPALENYKVKGQAGLLTINELGMMMTTRGEGSFQGSLTSILKEADKNLNVGLKQVELISAFRKVDNIKTEFDYSGSKITEKLAKLQDPSRINASDRLKFERVIGFLQEVTGSHQAKMRIPHLRDEILVTLDNREVMPQQNSPNSDTVLNVKFLNSSCIGNLDYKAARNQ